MKQIFFIGLILVIFSSCACRKNALAQEVFTKFDTVKIEKIVKLRDTVFFTQKSEVQTVFNCDSIGKKPLIKQEKNAVLTLKKSGENGKIIANCKCDTLAISAKIKSSLEKVYRNSTENQTKTIVKETKYIPLWAKILSVFGGIFIGIIAFNVLKALKAFIKIN